MVFGTTRLVWPELTEPKGEWAAGRAGRCQGRWFRALWATWRTWAFYPPCDGSHGGVRAEEGSVLTQVLEAPFGCCRVGSVWEARAGGARGQGRGDRVSK